jgi:hypothetical protein
MQMLSRARALATDASTQMQSQCLDNRCKHADVEQSLCLDNRCKLAYVEQSACLDNRYTHADVE